MKRVISLMLTVIMIASTLMFNVNASTTNTTEESEIVDALNAVECIKNQIGLSMFDFEQLSYSTNHIYAYDFTSDGLAYNSEFIPISYNNTLIGWIIKGMSGENAVYQFSTAFVKQVNSLVADGASIAFIYDYNASYLYDGSQLYKMGDISLQVESRSVLDTVDSLDDADITLNQVSGFIELPYTSYSSVARMPIYYSCSVSFISQNPPSNMCWAASAACIVNYLNGTNYTAASIAKKWYNTNSYASYNKGLKLGLQDDVLSSYGVSYTYKNRVPSDGIILNNICNGYPIQATYKWSGGYHDVVIYGINSTSGYIYIMDPEYGFCNTTYSTSSGYTYVSGYSGVTLTLERATCKYWTA